MWGVSHIRSTDGIMTVEIGPFCAMIFEEKVLDF